MWILLILIAILCVLIATIIKSGRENYGIIESGNIPVVPPSLFLGSETKLHKEVQHLEDVKRFKKYGGIWGVRISKIYINKIYEKHKIFMKFVPN